MENSSESSTILKTPKGTRDFHPDQMVIREQVMTIIREVFQSHGAVEIDTPVFELSEILKGKYGEANKLVYELNDQGGELLSLRYDLTVPFARYLASYNVKKMKRFHIAKVYRRDNPVMTKGRFREFFQCDFDVSGKYDSMLPDAEVLHIIDQILTKLEIGKYEIKVNHRELLDSLLEISLAPKEKFKQIFSTIDKLDKLPWEKVAVELIEERGLTPEITENIRKFVTLRDKPLKLLEYLRSNKLFDSSEKGLKALSEMETLFEYLTDLDCHQNIVFDLSLARGLDYYTGLICEATLLDESVGIGSIAGGGRYDDLVGMFAGEKIPAVGASVGIERLFSIIENKYKSKNNAKTNKSEVLIATIGSGMEHNKLKLASWLWKEGIRAEILYYKEAKPQKQLTEALEKEIPFLIWIGENEIKENIYKVKCLYHKEENSVPKEKLIDFLKSKISGYQDDLRKGLAVFEQKKK